MAPRNRTPNNKDLDKIPNLYRKIDKRTGRANFQYKDQRDGRFRGLGSDEEKAKSRAKQLNAAIYAQILQQEQEKLDAILAHPQALSGGGIKFKTWATHYIGIQQEAVNSGEIKPNTFKARKCIAKKWAQEFDDINIKNISVKDIASHLEQIRQQDKARMAQAMRSILIDVFVEAIQAGEADNNPAALTKNKTVHIKRARVTFDEWLIIYQAAEKLQPWVQNAMLIALLTAQRLEDISLARFKKTADWEPAFIAFSKRKPHHTQPYSYIADEHFNIIQQKTGTLIRIPLDLKLNCINTSLGAAISRCRKNTLSSNLIHHSGSSYKFKSGDPVHRYSISRSFQRARKLTDLSWEGKNPPTFHEQRSLSERLYHEQGIDTQMLLGHKSETMTATYHDVRGAEWLEIAIN